jgi:hypothetical protein
MRLGVVSGAFRLSRAVPGSVSASRRNGRMPRSSSASCQASLARATSAVNASDASAPRLEEPLRRAVSSRPIAAIRIAAAVTAPKTHPVVRRVRAKACSGLTILRM